MTDISARLDVNKKKRLKNFTLGLGPVSIAKYLDRAQLVVRLSPNEIRLEDFHQWAGSPRDDIPAVLLEDISVISGIKGVYLYPWKSYASVDYQIVVDLIRLDGRPGESVKLTAKWEILTGDGSTSVRIGKTDFTEPVKESDFDSFAAAQSRALAILSLEITEALAGMK